MPDFGTASAAKRGRNPRWPYVPIVVYTPGPSERRRTEQLKNRAFETRDEAIEFAQACIDGRRRLHERALTVPRLGALRESCGFPREITECAVTDGERIGQVVEYGDFLDDNAQDDFRTRLLIEWPGCVPAWSDTADVRLARETTSAANSASPPRHETR